MASDQDKSRQAQDKYIFPDILSRTDILIIFCQNPMFSIFFPKYRF